jgi:Tfp pilus assembly protein FimT
MERVAATVCTMDHNTPRSVRPRRRLPGARASVPTWSVGGSAGFTLVELIIIIMIIGLLTLYAVPRFDYRAAQVSALAMKLVEDLRYAQNRSMTTQRVHGFILGNCTGGNCTQYIIFQNGDPTDQAPDPLKGSGLQVDMVGEFSDLQLSSTLPAETVLFGPSGTPQGGPAAAPVALTAGANTIDITAGDFCSRITLTVTTGLISAANGLISEGACP